jgi:hypothetical protein
MVADHVVAWLGGPVVAPFVLWGAASAALLGLAVAFRGRITAAARDRRVVAFALVVVAVVVTGLHLRAAPTGDEPHYLLATQSLLLDGDLDLRNNYERLDYLDYHPTTFPYPHVIEAGDAWYPVHGIGVSLVALPWFAVGGRPGVVVMVMLMTVAGLIALHSLLRRAGLSESAARAATLIAGLALPLSSLSGQVFPEVPAVLLVVLGMRAALAATPSRWDVAILMASVACLPWLHAKHAAVAAVLVLGALLLGRWRTRVPLALAAGSALAVSIAGLAALSYRWYGVPLPGASLVMTGTSPYGEDWLAPLLGNFFVAPATGLLGVLLDQHSGLLFAAPVYALVIAGVILLWRRYPGLAVTAALVFLAIYLPAGAFGVWYGGFSSPARLLTPVVPVLAIGLAATWQWGGSRGRILLKILAVPTLVHAYLVLTLPSFVRYGDPATNHNIFIAQIERLAGVDLTLLFPSFRDVTALTWVTASGYVAAIAVLTTVVIREARVRDLSGLPEVREPARVLPAVMGNAVAGERP